MRRAVVVAAMIWLGVVGCARERELAGTSSPSPESVGPGVILRGRLIAGFESSDFQICGTKEHWWLSPPTDPDEIAAYIQATSDYVKVRNDEVARGIRMPEHPGVDVQYLVVRADTVSGGHFGHLGGATREVRVHEILEISSLVPADCVVDSVR